MTLQVLIIIVVILVAISFVLGRARALSLAGTGEQKLHSLPVHYGVLSALWCGLPALALLVAWMSFEDNVVVSAAWSELPERITTLEPDEKRLAMTEMLNAAAGIVTPTDRDIALGAERLLEIKSNSKRLRSLLTVALALIGAAVGLFLMRPGVRARNIVERIFTIALLTCASVALLTTIGIVLSVLFESILFFQKVPITDFLFGLEWSPQMAIREDQVGSSGSFGAVPLFAGTFLISAIAMLVAIPIGLMSAVYLAEYAEPRLRAIAKPVLEILAGIPTVVFGFFAAITVAPLLREMGGVIGLDVASESALAAGLVMGVMIIPFISSLSDDVITAVPQAMRDGSLALGATRSETVVNVVFPAALPGIVGGILLGVSRAVGETMIVVMAAGLGAKLTLDPTESVTTITVQIVTLLVGDQEFDSPKTLAAFALGLVLFTATLILNVIALRVVRKYREKYE